MKLEWDNKPVELLKYYERELNDTYKQERRIWFMMIDVAVRLSDEALLQADITNEVKTELIAARQMLSTV